MPWSEVAPTPAQFKEILESQLTPWYNSPTLSPAILATPPPQQTSVQPVLEAGRDEGTQRGKAEPPQLVTAAGVGYPPRHFGPGPNPLQPSACPVKPQPASTISPAQLKGFKQAPQELVEKDAKAKSQVQPSPSWCSLSPGCKPSTCPSQGISCVSSRCSSRCSPHSSPSPTNLATRCGHWVVETTKDPGTGQLVHRVKGFQYNDEVEYSIINHNCCEMVYSAEGHHRKCLMCGKAFPTSFVAQPLWPFLLQGVDNGVVVEGVDSQALSSSASATTVSDPESFDRLSIHPDSPQFGRVERAYHFVSLPDGNYTILSAVPTASDERWRISQPVDFRVPTTDAEVQASLGQGWFPTEQGGVLQWKRRQPGTDGVVSPLSEGQKLHYRRLWAGTLKLGEGQQPMHLKAISSASSSRSGSSQGNQWQPSHSDPGAGGTM